MREWSRIGLILATLPLTAACTRQTADDTEELYALALENRGAFAERLTAGASTDFERAHAVTTWFAGNFDWTATDYKRRTVEQILERRGGNCNELALVTTAMLEELELPMRRVREINIHVKSESRRHRAQEMVAEEGYRYSVFGKRHNDHVWLEIQDRETGGWFPADPSMGVIGEKEWLAARLGFGDRFTLNPVSEDMIAPFAIFAEDSQGDLAENRTAHYVINGLDALYAGRLQQLEGWSEWVRLVEDLDDKAHGAFLGEVNLHEYEAEIDALAETYDQLRSDFVPTTESQVDS